MQKPIVVFKTCKDDFLTVDLFLNGNEWQEGFQLPLHYTSTQGESKVDLVQAVRDALPAIATKAVIHVLTASNKSPKPSVWKWGPVNATRLEIVTCAGIKMRKTLYNAINIVPFLSKPVVVKPPTVRPRSSANNFLPLLVKEPWRPDEPTGRYPSRWWTLKVTSSDGKRVRNPRLPKDLVLPPSLVAFGEGGLLGQSTFMHNNSNVDLVSIFQVGDEFLHDPFSVLRVPPDSLTPEERVRANKLLKVIDFDYTLLKQDLAKNPKISEWFQKGFDILPDLERGYYMWVYTGVKKTNADHLISPLYGANLSTEMAMPLGQQTGDTDLPVCKEECRESSLLVDIFYDGKLLRENEEMPLEYWHRNGGGDTQYTDLIIEAKEWLCLKSGTVNSIALYVDEVKAKRVIIWEEQSFSRHLLVDCEKVRSLKGMYVAIGLSSSSSPPRYECSICENDALFGNKALQMMFCGKKCHDTFRDAVSK